jgi:hypothetical protein
MQMEKIRDYTVPIVKVILGDSLYTICCQAIVGLESQMSGVKLVDLFAVSRIEIKKKVGVIVLCATYRIVIQPHIVL